MKGQALARIGVALSGGVDSLATALILKDQGHQVESFTLRLGFGTDKALNPAEKVAKALGLRHHVIDVKDQFATEVVEKVVKTYASGKTPNPCVLCNAAIKIPLLWEAAKKRGCEKLATGHYTRLIKKNGVWLLRQGKDPKKSQAYFLARVPAWLWDHVIFPLGEMTKDEARLMACDSGLISLDEPESQDICFLPEGGFDELMKARGSIRPGAICDLTGKKLGNHNGIHRYTIGQRRGLGVALGYPGYVVRLNAQTNEVTIGSSQDLMSLGLLGKNPITCDNIEEKAEIKVRYRYNQAGIACRVLPQADLIRVEYESPQRAAPPGQLAVFYQGDLVVGSAWIKEAIYAKR